MTAIDYDAAQKQFRAQKSALTRAQNHFKKTGDPSRVILACHKAANEWNEPPANGAWPDSWHNWNIALRDVLGWQNAIELDQLMHFDKAGLHAFIARVVADND